MRHALALAPALAACAMLAACSNGDGSSGTDASPASSSDASTAQGDDASVGPGGEDGSVGPASDGGSAGQDAGAQGSDAATQGADAGSDPGPAAACAEAADAVCGQLEACSPFGLAAIYGDLATCKSRVALGCLPAFGAPGSSATTARTVQCAQALRQLSCEVVKTGDYGPACAAVPGALADGAACGDDSQCQSTFCARASTSLCGTCSPKSTEGGPCEDGACSSGLSCPTGASTCIKPVPGEVGDACTYQEQCDLAEGIVCDTAASKECIQVSVASGTGEACGLTMTGFVLCRASGACSGIFGGTCSAAAADGAACSASDTGPKCLSPARCVEGTCALPDPASCQ